MVSWLVANKRTRTQDCLKVLKLRAAPLHNAVLHGDTLQRAEEGADRAPREPRTGAGDKRVSRPFPPSPFYRSNSRMPEQPRDSLWVTFSREKKRGKREGRAELS